jgi:hypothetical protein
LTLTRSGFTWIQKKPHSASFPPPYGNIFIEPIIEDTQQKLDGITFIRPTFINARMAYSGDGNVQLFAPKISGTCSLTIVKGARKKAPEAVNRLKRLITTDKCKIFDEDSEADNSAHRDH